MNFLDILPIVLGVFWILGILWVHGKLNLILVKMEPGNRMMRIGLGQNDKRWFFRIDLWFFGIRIT